MKRGSLVSCVVLLALLAGLLTIANSVRAQQSKGVQWIWFDEGDPLKEAPAASRYFRKTFTVEKVPADAVLDITADNSFKVWINGTEAGSGSEWQRVYAFKVKPHLLQGKNVLAVQATNDSGPAGLMVRLSFRTGKKSEPVLVSDGSWKSFKEAPAGWAKADFDDARWPAAKALGKVGEAGPWQGLAWESEGGPVAKAKPGQFTVPEGFRVLPAVKNPYTAPDAPKKPFSLVNMCFDAKGRLLISEEGGPILICTDPDKDGVLQKVRPYCELVKNCHGMCWVDDALYLVGNGPKGTGLYRCCDTKSADKIDEATLLHAFNGGIGEHGPHAVFHGPDDSLYVVSGNHAHARVDGKQSKLASNSPLRRWPTGEQGPARGQAGSTEDVLLPGQNDANGHAANLKAPGGTIWRVSKDGKEWALVAAGFRNEFDAAVNSAGEVWTFDSDMEWDIGLPWYRPVRINFCPPGAEFGWRTGSQKIPAYALDTLPAVHDVGRGSPVGVEFYEHNAFPSKYHGCCFMLDWSLGIIYAVHPKRDGAGYKAEVEKFCTGNPANVTDAGVAPDGSLYFTMGGRGTQGGVYRIVYESTESRPAPKSPVQPLSAWGRHRRQGIINEQIKEQGKEKVVAAITAEVLRPSTDDPTENRLKIHLLNAMQNHGLVPDAKLLTAVTQDKDPEVRAHAIYLLGVNGYKEGKEPLLLALKDKDKLVQRRACEALIRAGFEPPIDAIWPLLADNDRFLRTAARLVFQRIDPKKWAERVWKEKDTRVAYEGIIALCKTNQAAPFAQAIFERLDQAKSQTGPEWTDWARVTQLAFIHTTDRPAVCEKLAERCTVFFPSKDSNAGRELAILLTYCAANGIFTKPNRDATAVSLLMQALQMPESDRLDQIHYFYCLRLLHKGWTPEHKTALLKWFESTAPWSGGNSFRGFLDNILRDAVPIFTPADRADVLAKVEQYPRSAGILLRATPADQMPPAKALVGLYERAMKDKARGKEVKGIIIGALAQSKDPEAQGTLRKIGDQDLSERDAVARALARFPSSENYPYLVRGLQSGDKLVLIDVIDALKKIKDRPKTEDAAPFRALLVAASKFDEKDVKNRWKMIELLRHWGVREFGGDPKQSKEELVALAKWFSQTFPKEPALPGSLLGKPPESKYKFDELLAYLEKDPEAKKGDVKRGRAVFEKAQCIKCHKFGTEGEGIGPDLSTLSKRFKRFDILESIIDPSKVISDQYRSSTIITKKGVQLHGLAATQGDTVTVLQSDGTKVVLKKDEIDQQIASLVSVMPEKLLDPLTKQEIADLFAFLESEPAK